MSEKEKKVIYSNDCFYDIETLTNIFTCAVYFPTNNSLVFYYLEDGKNPLTGTNEFKNNIANEVLAKNKNFACKPNPSVILYDLKTDQGYKSFIELFGLGTNQEQSKDSSDYIDEICPVKDTDASYDPEVHGKRFGYNSTNYDLTMLAYFFKETAGDYLKNKGREINTITAENLRQFNDTLFTEAFKKQMPTLLAMPWCNTYRTMRDPANDQPNYNTREWRIRKTWLITGRYIDVARLNDHMRTVGLKRILGMLGYQILESDKLTGKATIETVDEMLDLFAYNASDVVNLEELFLNNVYQSSYQNKTQLLNEYKELIYKQESPTVHKPRIAEDNVRRDRLCVDSSSAKFIENTLCPYGNGLDDQEFVDFAYPAKKVCEEKGYIQFNVLEDTKEWFEENVGKPGTPQHDAFMRVYNFYKEIEGKNFNDSERYHKKFIPSKSDDTKAFYDAHKAKDKRWVKDKMNEYNTNLFYYDKDGNETDSFVTFSIGGIHGQEINRKAFDKKYAEYKKEQDLLDWVKAQYNGDALEAVNGPVRITLPDGTEEKIRQFLKSGSTKKSATWREIREPKIFKIDVEGNIDLAKEYVYTSVGKANHEDFTSYYPMLLCNMAAFDNADLGEDRYYTIFEDRVVNKKKAKDTSYSEDERAMFNLIQNGKKLLLNSASGAGDASFESNIRMNNRTISMRIIGQLFAWRIGQAQALAGARVPSTNTDGLYTMDIDEDTNNRILQEVAKKMYINIEPEIVDNFVSKDSNNRLEYIDGKISEAKGGTLTSWGGPSPTNNLDHPAIVDLLLARYLTEYENSANKEFNRDVAIELFKDFWNNTYSDKKKMLTYLQMILASSDGTNRYVYATNHDGESYALQSYNRAFLTIPVKSSVYLNLATKRKLADSTYEKRSKENEPTIQHDPVAYKILQANGFTPKDDRINRQEAKSDKIKGTKDGQNFIIMNDDLHFIDDVTYDALLEIIDVNAYIDMLESTFNQNWKNN